MIVRMVNMNASILAGSITIDLGDGETIGGDGGEGDADDAAVKGFTSAEEGGVIPPLSPAAGEAVHPSL